MTTPTRIATIVPSSARGEMRVLLALAVPAALTQVATMLMGIVDTVMVARVDTLSLDAAALGTVWFFGVLCLGMGVLLGLDPIVTQAHGAGDGPRAGLAVQRGLVLALALSIPIGVLAAMTGPVLRLFGQAPELAALAQSYVLVQLPSIPAFLGFIALRQYLSGRGIVAPAMWIAWLANVVNLVLNWSLVFGHLGFAPHGLVGSGVATALSRGFMLVALAAWIVIGRLHAEAWRPWDRAALSLRGHLELVGLGLPIAVQLGLEVWCFQVATLFAGRLGEAALAAHVIALNLASLSFTVPFGIAIATTTRVGNLVGAREPVAARRAGWTGLALGGCVMTVFALLFVVLRRVLPLPWSPRPDVLVACAAILPIAGAFQIFDGLQAVGCGVLRGRGDTRPAALFNLLGYWILALPIGWFLAFRAGWGLPGLWWGLTLGLMTVAVLLVLRIRKG